jgi:hypothetical protein
MYFVGVTIYPDAPLHECAPPSGYCGKAGQDRTAADYYGFMVWRISVILTLVVGLIGIKIWDRFKA